MRVGHQHAAFVIDRQAGRLARFVVGRLPAAQEVAVGVEDLDAGRHVDDVEPVLAVDGHGPRLLQPAVGNTAPTPDQIELADPRQAVFVFIAAGQGDHAQAGQAAFVEAAAREPARTWSEHRLGRLRKRTA